MTNLKLLLFAFTLLLTTTSSFAQSDVKHTQTHRKSTFKVDESTPIFDKETGKQLTEEEFRDIIKKNPRVHLEKEINESGNIARLIYDPNGSGITMRDPNKRVKPNEAFPEFIFTTTTNEQLASKDLAGNVIVLYFNMALAEPYASQQKFADFEKVLKGSPISSNILPIIITHSNTEEALAFTKDTPVPYPIVPNAINFFDRYTVIKFPSFVVINKDGTLGAYADNLDELKEVITKLI